MIAAQLRQGLLRPATLAGRIGRSRRALDLLLTKFARRDAEAMAERPAEMRGIIEAVAEGDFGDRMVRLGRVRQFRRGPLQPALAQVMREAASRALKQLLHVALGYPLGLRHPRRRKIGIVKLAFDGPAETVKDRRLRGGASGLRRRCHQLPDECRQQVGKALGEHLGEAAGGQHPDLVEDRLAYLAAMKCIRCHRQNHGTHVTLEGQAPVALSRQQQEVPNGNDLMAAGGPERDPVLARQQHDRHVVGEMPQRRYRLRSRRQPCQHNALGTAARCRRVPAVNG